LRLVSEWIAYFLIRSANSHPPCFRRQGFGRQNNKNSQQPGRGNGQPAQSPTYQSSNSSLAPSVSPGPHSPGLHQAMSYENMQSQSPDNQPRRPPFFFRDDYANLIVKGNFMTLAAKPVLVEEGEWLAHQGGLF
jgi:hypothetical protein